MGFDLYGLNPKGDVPKPVITDWGDKKQADDFFKYQDETPGSYFRANVWYWRPLWQYVTVTCDDILTEKDMESGAYNDGHRISKTKANRIASRLKKLDKDGSIMKYELGYKEYLKSLPKEKCGICEGTGRRKKHPKKGRAFNNAGDMKCNGCEGIGNVNNFGTHYPFESEEIVRFAEFCEQSGGFEIC